MKLAMSHDVSSPHNGAVFWSGGDLALEAVGQFMQRRTVEGSPASTSLRGHGGRRAMAGASSGIGSNEKGGKPNGAPWGERIPGRGASSPSATARGASGDVNVIVVDVPVGKGQDPARRGEDAARQQEGDVYQLLRHPEG